MAQEDGGYEIKPDKNPAVPPGAEPGPTGASGPTGGAPKPGEPGWVPPVPIIEEAEVAEEDLVDPDVEQNKGVAVLAYILFLIPLVAAPNSKFARYHANQGLLSFILLIVVCMAVAILQGGKMLAVWGLHRIPVLDLFFACGLSVLQPALLMGWLALMIVGIINAANGLKKPLPVVGHWTLIKWN
jgi:uncharacterized membrane protein